MKSYHDWKYQFLTNILILNAGLDELQARIKIAGRNMNNLRCADTILMAESEEELNSLLMRVKEESVKAGLKLNNKKTKIMASGSITSWQIDAGGGIGNSDRLHSLELQKSVQMVTAAVKLKDPCSLEEKL